MHLVPLLEVFRPLSRLETFGPLQRAGWEEMGSGTFRTLFQKQGVPYVLKVFLSKDTCYTNYLGFVQANQNSPYVPKIHGKLVYVRETINAVRMERLEPNLNAGEAIYVREQVEDMIDHYRFWNNPYASPIVEKYPGLDEVCRKIGKLFRSGCLNDVAADNNIMWRGETPVIVDPVFTPL